VFLPRGIHHLQAWNESLCAGRWGRLLASLSERLRRAADLEHWAAFNRSFEQLCDWLRRIAGGTPSTPPPASILLLGGDVHCSSVSKIHLGAGALRRPGDRLSLRREDLLPPGEAGRRGSAVCHLAAASTSDVREYAWRARARGPRGDRDDLAEPTR